MRPKTLQFSEKVKVFSLFHIIFSLIRNIYLDIDRYDIKNKIGERGFSNVYLVKDIRTKKRMQLKYQI